MDDLQKPNLAERVRAAGWLQTSLSKSKGDLATDVLRLSTQLGHPLGGRNGALIENLSPQTRAFANPKSLSAKHGLNGFPFHTDGAHAKEPPRFIVLACSRPGTSPAPTNFVRTTELDLDAGFKARLQTTPFVVRNGRYSFYSTILDSTRPFVRFDPGCMIPVAPEGQAVLESFAARLSSRARAAVAWEERDVLIFDNWAVFHARGSSEMTVSSDRMLLRVSVQ